MKTYHATVERDGKWWMVAVPEIDGLTQARSLAQAEAMARSLIAVTLDTNPSSFNVDIAVHSVGDVPDVSAEVEAIAGLREQAARDDREATRKAAALAKRLAGADVTVRDIGSVMGVSYQRAHQLVNA